MRAATCFLLLVAPLLAQDFAVTALSRRILTNEGVVTLARAGFDELFIVERIKTSHTRFDMSVEGMVSLKGAGVTDDLIGVMALQDRRDRLAALATAEPSQNETAPMGTPQPARVMVERHWWGFRWVRAFP